MVRQCVPEPERKGLFTKRDIRQGELLSSRKAFFIDYVDESEKTQEETAVTFNAKSIGCEDGICCQRLCSIKTTILRQLLDSSITPAITFTPERAPIVSVFKVQIT